MQATIPSRSLALSRDCEEVIVREVERGDTRTKAEYSALADNLIVHAKWPMRWLYASCEKRGSSPKRYDMNLYHSALKISDLAREYLSFESAFSYATYGLLALSLERNRIKTSGPMREDARFDAYDRLTDIPDTATDDSDVNAYLSRVSQTVAVRGNLFRYQLDPRVVQTGLDAMGPSLDQRFTLPPIGS